MRTTMDFDQRYRAMESRDESFAGDFLAAVTTTGIYCRPGCLARTPKRENVRFGTASVFETDRLASPLAHGLSGHDCHLHPVARSF